MFHVKHYIICTGFGYPAGYFYPSNNAKPLLIRQFGDYIPLHRIIYTNDLIITDFNIEV